jgi:hypothetical protein
VLLEDLLGLVDRAAHALGRGREHDLRAQRLEQPRRSMLIDSGIVRISL